MLLRIPVSFDMRENTAKLVAIMIALIFAIGWTFLVGYIFMETWNYVAPKLAHSVDGTKSSDIGDRGIDYWTALLVVVVFRMAFAQPGNYVNYTDNDVMYISTGDRTSKRSRSRSAKRSASRRTSRS